MRENRLLRVETERRDSLSRALELTRSMTDATQGHLFTKHDGVGYWDLTFARQVIHTPEKPIETFQTILEEQNYGFLARMKAARVLMDTGDIQRAQTVAELQKLHTYQTIANDRQRYVTGMEIFILNRFLGDNKLVQDYILDRTIKQVALIESGNLDTYKESIELAMTLWYYQHYKKALHASITKAAEVIRDNPQLFSGATLNDKADFSGAYAEILLNAKVADSSDVDHPESAAFTRGLWGAKGVLYRDSLAHSVLSMFGHSAATGLLMRTNDDIVAGKLVSLLAEADKPTRAIDQTKGDDELLRQVRNRKITRFGLRFGMYINAMKTLYEKTDDGFSLGVKGGNSKFYNAPKGKFILDPDQILFVLDRHDKQEQVIRVLQENGVSVVPTVSAETLRQLGASRQTAGELSNIYAKLTPFQQSVVLGTLPTDLYRNINYKDVLSGKAISPEALTTNVITAIDTVTSHK